MLTSSARLFSKMKTIGENVVRIEAEALRALADRIAGPMAAAFERAVDLLFCCAGRVVVTGMGKSGLIARKIAATLSSTGSPALYLHPVDAVHGDLGMVVRGDVVLALSASGETEEILALLAPTAFHASFRCRCSSRLLDHGRSLLAGPGSHRFDDNDAGPGRRPCRNPQRKTWIQRRRFCQPASRRQVGQALGARGIADALGRWSPLCLAADENARCNLRNVAQEAGRDGGGG